MAMGDVEQPKSTPLVLRPWVPWLFGTVAVVQAWAFVDNARERDWALAGYFGLGTLVFVAQVIGLWWIRRRNRHSASRADIAPHRP